VRLLVGVLLAQLVLGGAFVYVATQGFPLLGGEDGAGAGRHSTAATASPRADRFDGPRAFALLRAQVALGPRPAGSAPSRRLARRLARLLPHGRLERVPGHPRLRNVVGHLPGRRPAIAIAAHYDTKDLPGFVGANDGAAGTAAVVELARALRPGRPRELRFLLFDGEESPRGTPDALFQTQGLRGSRAYAGAHAQELGALILLDFIANRDLRLPREESSDPRLWERLRVAASRIGLGSVFPSETVPAVYDDHTPFLGAGVPAVDLIDFDYACFHQPCDDLRHVSPRSLDAAGEAVAELVRGLSGSASYTL
jgi:glutaminyl-peptide cyclotransferase